MHNRFLTHDVAMELATEIVEVYTRLKAGLEDFEERTSRMQLRMKPCSFTRLPEGI